MKKLIALLLAVTLFASLCACGTEATKESPLEADVPAPEETATELAPVNTETAIAALVEFFEENGNSTSVYTLYDGFDSGITDVSFFGGVEGEKVLIAIRYINGKLSTSTTSAYNVTTIYFSGGENQTDGTYYVTQKNTGVANGTELTLSASYDLTPAEFTTETPVVFSNPQSSANNPDAEIAEAFTAAGCDGIHTTLEIFTAMLEQSGLGLTLADFGFTDYVIDEERESDIRSGAWAKEPAPPAPVEISINDLADNSIGTPEIMITFTNTGDVPIEALDFYVMCYDAYGEAIRGYGYDMFTGTYQFEPIPPGGSSVNNGYWPMYGFENAKTASVAVCKYLLTGGEPVEIPYNELVWVDMQ